MNDNIYLICCYYYYNHITNKDKIGKWAPFYSDLLYGDLQRNRIADVKLEPVFWKRLYNKYGEEAIDILESNIQYCEIRHKLDLKKK